MKQRYRIAIGSLAQESNSFSPFITAEQDFDCRFGQDVLEKFNAATQVFADADCALIPTVSAYALPGGAVEQATFLKLCDVLIARIPADIDGVWLHLHGAMYVSGLTAYDCSGEAYLLAKLRETLGRDVPIAACMDMHANHSPEFVRHIDIVRGYHTAPHEAWDFDHCCTMTACALLDMLRGRHMRSYLRPLPLRLAGERFMTSFSPARETVQLCEALEQQAGVVCATVFVGMAWCDTPHNTLSVLLTVDDSVQDPARLADPLCDFILQHRDAYGIPARNLPPDEALAYCAHSGKRPFYLSDSGDNVTAGAAGDSALCLQMIIAKNMRNLLIAGITDREFVSTYFDAPVGTVCRLPLGGKTDPASVQLRAEGTLLGSGVYPVGACKHVQCVWVRYCDTTVIVTDVRCDFVDSADIAAIAGDPANYSGVVVKLGYLFPLLQETAADSCIMLTPGNCSLDPAAIHYTTKAFFE